MIDIKFYRKIFATKDPVASRPSSVARWAAASRPGPHCRLLVEEKWTLEMDGGKHDFKKRHVPPQDCDLQAILILVVRGAFLAFQGKAQLKKNLPSNRCNMAGRRTATPYVHTVSTLYIYIYLDIYMSNVQSNSPATSVKTLYKTEFNTV